ncbi:MAG: DUF3540 domain-containing protein [Myxococcota bacterium]
MSRDDAENDAGDASVGAKARSRLPERAHEMGRVSSASPATPHELVADGGMRVRLLEGGAALEVRDAEGRLRVRFEGNTMVLGPETGDLVLAAPKGRVILRGQDVALEATRDTALTAGRALRVRGGRIELDAEQLFERTRDCIREAKGLVLSRAGAMRTIVRERLSFRSRRTDLRSEKDTEIDGRRVLLG